MSPLDKLYARLRYVQCMNRVAAKELVKGRAEVKRLATLIRAYPQTKQRAARRRAPSC